MVYMRWGKWDQEKEGGMYGVQDNDNWRKKMRKEKYSKLWWSKWKRRGVLDGISLVAADWV